MNNSASLCPAMACITLLAPGLSLLAYVEKYLLVLSQTNWNHQISVGLTNHTRHKLITSTCVCYCHSVSRLLFFSVLGSVLLSSWLDHPSTEQLSGN